MIFSKFVVTAASFTMDTIFKASEADMRVHGIENIPPKHVLYVVNHFTRIETIFLPYAIHKHTGQLTFSLAAAEFFNGKLAAFLEKFGGVSTEDPNRDTILTNALLSGEASVIIYPEGQMIKDKKLIEKGKYLVYNAGIRRPPHTGAAKIALRVEIFRQVIKKLHEEQKYDEIAKIKEKYNLKDENLIDIITGSTHVVPVNITYYPIRAKNNIIKKTIERFTGETKGRIAEELEVEGTMLAKGVDVDINFGKAIKINEYLDKFKLTSQIFQNSGNIDYDEYIRKMDIKKPIVKLSNRYMKSIYNMTTVNHDHIFAYILKKHPHTVINDYDFKNRASLAIEKIKELNLSNFHSTLITKNANISADTFHEKYNSFIDEAVANGLIVIKENKIIKDNNKFTPTYNFHQIRRDNFVEVLNNEIEPLTELTKMLKRIMILPPILIKYQIRNTFLRLDKNLFTKDYDEFYVEGESKPSNIGEPFFLYSPFNKHGLILVHGYMAAPEEIRLLAEKIHAAGYAVYAVRLRGHGTSPDDLATRNWEEWYESVNRGYVIMKNSVKDFAIAGFSTGAGLALLQAIKKGDKLKGVIPISAPLRLQDIRAHLSGAVVMYNNIVKKFKLGKKVEFIQNKPENPHINYARNPVKGTYEIGQLMNVVNDSLSDIEIPALIIQASKDPVVNPSSAEEIFQKISSTDKEIIKISSERHGIVRDAELSQVAEHVISFLNRIFKKK